MNMERLLLSKLITFQLPAVKILLADLQAILLRLLFRQLNISAVLKLLLHKQWFQISLLRSFNHELSEIILLQGFFSSQILLMFIPMKEKH